MFKIFTVLVGCVFLCGLSHANEVNLHAAASLTDALTELSNDFEKLHPGVTIKKSFAGSSTLAKQIENGAPTDLFISADTDWVDYLQTRGILDDASRKKLLNNELVLIAPLKSKVNILLDPAFNLNTAVSGRICTGDPTSVPVGKYAKQSLVHYNWWNKIESRVVGTEDVRTALMFVEREECGLGIVYKTDALLSKKIKIIATFPDPSHKPIEYPGALTKTADSDAKEFWMFLQSKNAKSVFSRYGFKPVD
ncbi:MAG: molybdate ABC transporter substrate-binding protein [Gammaproteobacteria bacterium]|nr:MAG: molybdate ABC transporter substrate-binding protein [Gammaproteobacteria bacterium]